MSDLFSIEKPDRQGHHLQKRVVAGVRSLFLATLLSLECHREPKIEFSS